MPYLPGDERQAHEIAAGRNPGPLHPPHDLFGLMHRISLERSGVEELGEAGIARIRRVHDPVELGHASPDVDTLEPH